MIPAAGAHCHGACRERRRPGGHQVVLPCPVEDRRKPSCHGPGRCSTILGNRSSRQYQPGHGRPGERGSREPALPYGEERWSSGTLPTDYRFTGQRQDSGLRLYHMGARFYDSSNFQNRRLDLATTVDLAKGVGKEDSMSGSETYFNYYWGR